MYVELLSLVIDIAVSADETPEAEDVKAGWTAFAVFGLLILAVVVLAFSLVKRLRNVDRAETEGRYDPSTRKRTPPPETG